MANAAHRNRIYVSHEDDEVIWFEAEPALSMGMIEASAFRSAPVIDAGGGACRGGLSDPADLCGGQAGEVLPVRRHAPDALG